MSFKKNLIQFYLHQQNANKNPFKSWTCSGCYTKPKTTEQKQKKKNLKKWNPSASTYHSVHWKNASEHE